MAPQPHMMSDLYSSHQSGTTLKCTTTLQLWFQYFCLDKYEITAIDVNNDLLMFKHSFEKIGVGPRKRPANTNFKDER